MNILIILYCFLYLGTINSIQIELNSFSEIVLPKGISEYTYNYSYSYNNANIKGYFLYFFIKVSDYSKINKIYEIKKRENSEEEMRYIHIPQKKDEWISIELNYLIDKMFYVLHIETTEKNLKLKFLDSTQIIDINLKQFLNLNIITHKLYNKGYPLLFNIKPESNTLFSVQTQNIKNSFIVGNKYDILSYCTIEENDINNNCEFIETNDFYLSKNKNYRFKLHYYQQKYLTSRFGDLDGDLMIEKMFSFFEKYEVDYFLEGINFKNNSFIVNDFTENNYLFLNIKNYSNISLILKDNTGFVQSKHKLGTISPNNWDDFVINFRYYVINAKYKEITNGKIMDINNTLNDEYLIIRLNGKNKIKREGYILIFNENYEIKGINWSKEINKNVHCLLKIKINTDTTGIIVTSYNNMKLLFNYNNSDFTNKIVLNEDKENFIYINSTRENTFINCQFFETNMEFYNYKLIMQNDIDYILNKYNSDYFFFMNIYNEKNFEFFSYYFLDIKEKYYIYIKKYFGNFDLFKYKKELNLFSNISEYFKPISYYDKELYENVNNKLIIITGTQFFNYYIKYGTYFNFFIHKVNDNNYIDINIKMNKYSKSIFRMLNPKKNYYIKFELNHLIKLDNDFLDAEITIRNKYGIKYILNKKNKMIYLSGNGYTLESNKLALIYFYEKIENKNERADIEFNEYNNQIKSLRINIKNKNNENIKIAIAKGFGFTDYYPIIDYNNLEIYEIPRNKTINIYLENYFNLLGTNIYSDEIEKYFIYIFEIQNNNKIVLFNRNNIDFNISKEYNVFTEFNKFNFGIIPKGDINLVLKSSNFNFKINYQFVKCSNNDIDFNLKSFSNDGNLIKNEKYKISTNSLLRKEFENENIIYHFFESKNEFLFKYSFIFENYKNNSNYFRNENYGIKYVNINIKKNSISVSFTPVYFSFSEYHIIISRKNELNNLYSFLNPCHIIRLINSPSDEICIKKVYHINEKLITEDIDISNILPRDENDEYIITIISNDLYQFTHLDIYTPVIFNEKLKIKNAKKFNFFGINDLIPEKDYFIYENLNNEKQVLHIDLRMKKYEKFVLILEKEGEIIKKYYIEKNQYFGKNIEIIFEEKGIYFLYFINLDGTENHKIYFTTYLFNSMIENIDLNKNYYFGFLPNFEHLTYPTKDLAYYTVSYLKEDKNVFFISEKNNKIFSPITICENVFDNCKDIDYSYYFLRGKKYTIYIKLSMYYPESDFIYFYTYSFFPVVQNTIYNITNCDYYIIDSPTIFSFDENKEFYIYSFNAKIYFLSSNGIYSSRFRYSYNINDIDEYNIDTIHIDHNREERKIVVIPQKNNKLKQIYISTEKILESNRIEIEKGKKGLIYLDEVSKEKIEKYNFKYLENYFETYTSPIDNLRFISFDKIFKNKNFIFNHFGEKYLYYVGIDSYKNDKIAINRTIYQPKFVLFSILNDETINYFKAFIESINININKRINTNNLLIYDLINIYIDNFDIEYNLYIKKYYGSLELYESKYELNDISNNISILTKPINNLTNKRSIFNRLIKLNNNQIITGYISDNSLLDIYFEQDNNNKDIYLSDFKNRKYIKKGIEYQIHFNLNHLIKLEYSNDTDIEIIIYNENTKIILNNKNKTGIVLGNSFKIISNNNALIYFYPKTTKFQIKLNPNKGDIIAIKLTKNYTNDKFFFIDFGFEGYEPPNMDLDYSIKETLYIENPYDKLETELEHGEYLYLYYNYYFQDIFEIIYLNNKYIISNFNYNLNLIKVNNIPERNLIIPDMNKKKIKFQINQCNPSSSVNSKFFFYMSAFTEYKDFQYINENNKINKYFPYETENDFILSYSYIDIKDDFISKNKQWENDRIKYNDLIINNIKIINQKEVNINFNVNYKNSLTKYIIIITPEEDNNNFENLKNFCFLAELINSKENNFISEVIYDIGENDSIEINIDIKEYISENKNFVVNIISQELRYEKAFNFYEPKIYYIWTIKRYILFIFVLCFVLIFVFYFYKNSFKNIKKIRRNKNVTYEENFGLELNDQNDFQADKNN